MQTKTNIIKVQALIHRHWFNLLILALLLFVFFRKDMSFSLNIGAPDNVDKTEKTIPAPPKKAPKTKELLTEKQVEKTPEKSELHILGFGIGGSKANMPGRRELLDKVEESSIRAYIKRFSHVAENEQKKFGVPASIILANAVYLSQAGRNSLSREANNHFYLSCGAAWSGSRVEAMGGCYRAYDSAWSSFRDHSVVVTTGAFADLLQFGDKDYKSWARGLERLKFAGDTELATHLQELIGQYGLDQFDD